MARIERDDNNNNNGQGAGTDGKKEKTLEELKAELAEVYNKIRAIINNKADRNDLREEEKTELRNLYNKAARLNRTLAERHNDAEIQAKYREAYEKASQKAASYGSSIKSTIPKTTLDDIKGLENVKELVRSFLFMLNNPQLLKYYHMDGGLGMMMYGAPGTGKTMFAEAVANFMKLPLFIVTPADIFKSYVGASEAAVKQLFEEIDACETGAVLFIDECESIFSKRKEGTQDYKSAVTTELLQRMNGFGVDGAKRVMIAATNRPQDIDSAYLRFKRFSHLIHVTPPDKVAKRAIIEGKLKGIALADDVSIDKILEISERYELPQAAPASTNTAPVAAPGTAGSTLALAADIAEEQNNPAESGRRYYSAADICGIMEEACRQALVSIEINKGTTPIPLTLEMFEKAFRKIGPSIPESLIAELVEFGKTKSG